MARLRQGRSCQIAHFRILLPALLLPVLFGHVARSEGLSERPVLIVDPGMHTGPIDDAAVDAAGRFAATVSLDKTLRIWSLGDGRLLQTFACLQVPLKSANWLGLR
jgi:Nucleoporin Nup120/160